MVCNLVLSNLNRLTGNDMLLSFPDIPWQKCLDRSQNNISGQTYFVFDQSDCLPIIYIWAAHTAIKNGRGMGPRFLVDLELTFLL